MCFCGEMKELCEGVCLGYIFGSKNVFFGEFLNEDKMFKFVEVFC